MAKQYRKKPVVITAVQWRGDNADAICGPGTGIRVCGNTLVIPTLEGHMMVSLHDWVICGIKGEFYPCKPDIFAATYEEV